ncbi:MAG: ribosome maturation factor RimM [bacterium]|nr:ribosome maturation factor RimM [bacterium]
MSSARSRNTPPPYLLLGEILRPHGIRGELRVKMLTDYPERIAGLKAVFLGTSPEDRDITSHAVEHMRMHQDYGLLKLHGVDDRNEAELLRSLLVMVRIEDAVPLEDDEIYLFQLIGLEVRTADGAVFGEITDVLETGANDVYVIASREHGEVLLPVIPDTIVETNVDEGFVTVNIPEGLLPS